MSISYGGDYITDTDGGKLRPSSAVMRNRIINGAMVIDQRNAGASVTPTSPTYITDRWQAYNNSGSGRYTIAQSSTAPEGFNNSLLVTSTGAYSVGSSDILVIRQAIEGYNIADLGWGTANAKSITFSFKVRSSLTGTFGGSLSNNGGDRNYAFTYTVSSANTWETKTVTIAGCTDGTWLTTNGVGLNVWFQLGVGSTYSTSSTNSWLSTSNVYGVTGATSVVGTSGATFYITGVQLEVGSNATGFEYRQYGTELELCQRYLPAFTPNGSTGVIGQGQMWNNTTTFSTFFTYQTTTRVPPTGITVSSLSHFKGNGVVTDVTSLSAITLDAPTVNGATIRGVGTGGTANQLTGLIAINASAQLLLTGCEL